jgi:hypothetical protein
MKDETNDMIPGDPVNKISTLLDGHLSPLMRKEELKDFKEQLPGDFVEDASEGLDLLKNKKKLESDLNLLNRQLLRTLGNKKTRKSSHSIGNLSWTYWAIIIVFLLTITGFIIIRMLLQR